MTTTYSINTVPQTMPVMPTKLNTFEHVSHISNVQEEAEAINIGERDFGFQHDPASIQLDWPMEKHPNAQAENHTQPKPDLNWMDEDAILPADAAAARAEALAKLVSGSPAPSVTSPRRASNRSMIRSIRQSMYGNKLRKAKWFETTREETLTFRFVVTPKSGGAKKAKTNNFAHVPAANEDGSCPELDSAMEAPPPSGGGVSLGELLEAGDVAGFQKLLACSMFLMHDVPRVPGAMKPLDLNLRQKNEIGPRGTMLNMKHQNMVDWEKEGMVKSSRNVAWKVKVRAIS